MGDGTFRHGLLYLLLGFREPKSRESFRVLNFPKSKHGRIFLSQIILLLNSCSRWSAEHILIITSNSYDFRRFNVSANIYNHTWRLRVLRNKTYSYIRCHNLSFKFLRVHSVWLLCVTNHLNSLVLHQEMKHKKNTKDSVLKMKGAM
jgi:hypothetical protein